MSCSALGAVRVVLKCSGSFWSLLEPLGAWSLGDVGGAMTFGSLGALRVVLESSWNLGWSPSDLAVAIGYGHRVLESSWGGLDLSDLGVAEPLDGSWNGRGVLE